MKLKMDKSSYKSAENYLGKGEKSNTIILAPEPQVLRQWDDGASRKVYRIPSQGINMPSRLMALKMF